MNKSQNTVFISHASEDKERFVIPFAEYLKSKGINVWLDKWEMLPGDSLVDKIFEEGLQNSSAVIVILSKNSIVKKWVHEELNFAVINRINKKSKLIPVIIDDLKDEELPVSIRDTFWEKIIAINNFYKQADKIISAILDLRKAPFLGVPPKYSTLLFDRVGELTSIDTLVLKTMCEISIDCDNIYIDGGILMKKLMELELPTESINESIQILNSRYYIEEDRRSIGFTGAKVTNYGFHEYAQKFLDYYNDTVLDIASLLVNRFDEFQNISQLVASLKKPFTVIEQILVFLEDRNYIKTQTITSNQIHIYDVSIELKRFIAN